MIYLYILGKAANREGSFFKKNIFIGMLLFALWYGVFESFANYQVLTERVARIHLIIKLKNGKVIKTDNVLAYAGRTKTNWFFYNSKTKMVRTIKNDDVDIVDFDTILK